MKNYLHTFLISALAVVSCSFTASAMALALNLNEVFVAGEMRQPLKTNQGGFNQGDTMLTPKGGASLSLYRDWYLDVEATLPAVIGDNSDDFSAGTLFEVEAGYARPIASLLGVDAGVRYRDSLDMDVDDIDLYLGGTVLLRDNLSAHLRYYIATMDDKDNHAEGMLMLRLPASRSDIYGKAWTQDYAGTDLQYEFGVGRHLLRSWYIQARVEGDAKYSDTTRVALMLRYDFL